MWQASSHAGVRGRGAAGGAFQIAGLWNQPAVLHPPGLLLGQEEKIACPTGRSKQVQFKRGPGGRPTREEAERRHRSLIEAAFRLFAEKGWEGVSVDEISRRAGVAKGFIYARYPDKAALFVAAIERLMEDAMGTLQISEPLPAMSRRGFTCSAGGCSTSCCSRRRSPSIGCSSPRRRNFPGLAEHSSPATLLDLIAGVLAQ